MVTKASIDHGGLGRQTWAWLLGAPLSVILTLLVAQNVWAVFALYQVGFCLVFPVIINIALNRKSFRDHLGELGLLSASRRTLVMGGGLALLAGASLILLSRLFGTWFFDGNQVEQVLARWSVFPHQYVAIAVFMGLVNGPAEELFWRGFLHTRIQDRLSPGKAFGLTALFYASYHGVTVFLFLSSAVLALAVVLFIASSGFFWAWLREKTRSVWPALFIHSAATWAYILIWFSLEGGP